MQKQICAFLRVVACSLCLAFLCAGTAQAEEDGIWRLDAATGAVSPRSFRFMTDEFSVPMAEAPSRAGLDTLRCSASAQPSGAALPMLLSMIRERAGAEAPVYLVDLRQESHGFVNGDIPVSWNVKRNWGNNGLDAAQAEATEAERLSSLVGEEAAFVPTGEYDAAHLSPVTVFVKTAEPERTAAERAGFRYFRITATDHTMPPAEAVDSFLRFWRSLPEGTWLHFHCHAGHGRTTTFTVFYDILENPGVPLETITARQYALGGTSLLAPDEKKPWKIEAAKERAERIRAFYEYVEENRSQGFPVTFAQWSEGR